MAIQEASEACLIRLFKVANLFAIHENFVIDVCCNEMVEYALALFLLEAVAV
jgi:hypothetical protein